VRAKLDENFPVDAAELLHAAGWTCETLHDEGLGGAEDAEVAATCRTEGRVLFTLDLDFSDIRGYPPNEYVGIVVFRPAEPSRRMVLQMMTRLLPVLAARWADHQLWIIEPARVRVRGATSRLPDI
jgi:predicted nuclease of predicted toxin-antitoxin system